MGEDVGEIVDKIITTLIGVAIAVGVSAGLWVGVNLLFHQTTTNWRKFSAIATGICAAIAAIVLDGNRALKNLGPQQSITDALDDVANVSPPVTMAILLGVVGLAVGKAVSAYRGNPAFLLPVAAGFAVLGLLLGLTRTEEVDLGRFADIFWWPLIVALLGGAAGWILGGIEGATTRRPIGLGAGAGVGLLFGAFLTNRARPEVDIVATVVATLIGAALLGGLATVRKRAPIPGVLIGGALGWIVGAFGLADLGGGPSGWGLIAMAVPFALIGLRIGWNDLPDVVQRAQIDAKARSWIFLGPAVGFISLTVIVPLLRTIYLSFLDERSENYVGFGNYADIFGNRLNEESFDLDNWSNLFTSRLFLIGIPLLIIGGIIGVLVGRTTGNAFTLSSPSSVPMAIGFFILAFALFTTVRGTVINNLWWVFTVTLVSTGLGLAIAALADRTKLEKVAKALIFMPMAISFVGASIIWRAVYTARDPSKAQTGVLNAIWVGLGRLSTGSGLPTLIASAVLLLALAVLIGVLVRAVVRKSLDGVAPVTVGVILLTWFTYRFLGPGIGGFRTGANDEQVADTILFVQNSPFNSFWLMVILIWIQTGFAMVILSAAIKAVPAELTEAARVDGATEGQIFWRITIPQILPTLGVVITTIIVVVMKVFDIVKVITNGQFETQVLANQMFNEAFSFRNRGVGSALAIVLFLSVLPVMVYNIRRMQAEEA